MTRRDYAMLLLFVVVCQSAGGLGALFIWSEISIWYAGLTKSWFNPPAWLFASVWVTLYALMAVAAWQVWRRRKEQAAAVRAALALFALQLLVNAAWTPVFFGWHALGMALATIILLLALIAATIIKFRRVHRPAGWLLIPYFAWVAFAAILTGEFWRLNGC